MDQRHQDPATFVHRKQPMVENPSRLQAVIESGLLDSAADPLFDELCLLAAETAETPIALVTILDDQRQFFKARIGLEATETPVEWSACQHSLAHPERVLVVPDARQDERFWHNPLVTGEPFIRAYMGAPLVDQQGASLGTLCVIDHQPRAFSKDLEHRLARMAKVVSALIDQQTNVRRTLEAVKQEAQDEIEQLVVVLTQSLDVQAYADTNGIYRYANQAFANAFGCEVQQIVGCHMRQITGQSDFDQWVRQPFETALSGQPARYRRLARYPTWGDRWIDVELFPVRDGEGPVKGVVLRSRDVHDIVLAQQTIERRLINQQQFLNVLAHDVREPLRTIQGYVSLALEEGKPDLSDDILGFLRQVQRGGKRLSVLIDDLLSFLRADGEKIRTEPINLKSLIESVVEDLGELMREQGAVVTHEAQAFEVVGARVWLRLLLQNLITNAIKYAQPGVTPVVAVAARVAGNEVTLTVSDNGVGISVEDRNKLFRPFVRLASSASVEGSGLGLALCQKVAELHGTTIGVDSTPGVGSVFSITLPVAHPASPPAMQPIF